MYARWDDIRFTGKDVKVLVDGEEARKVTELMTGKRGFVTCYEQPFRIIGDNVMMRQIRGNVTLQVSK